MLGLEHLVHQYISNAFTLSVVHTCYDGWGFRSEAAS